ncbi:MAG: alpha/beta fold hydrolase [Gammaproteobacteria bacterium]
MLNNEYYTAENHAPFEYFALGDFALESGQILKNAQIAYSIYGKLNADRSNAILFTIMFSGTSKNMAHYIGPGKALDPEKYCIILPNQLGNGLSTSPHNIDGDQAMENFPALSIGDDVVAQHRLLSEKFNISQLQLVTGWSMGAQQTLEWAIRYPDMVKRAAPVAGTAQCTRHNALYVDVFCEALTSDPAFKQGAYTKAHSCELGLKRLAHVFALMGVSAELYNQQQWQRLGFDSQQAFLEGFWEAWFKPMDPNALLVMARKWQGGDSSQHANNDLVLALQSIKAKTFMIGFEEDMFVPPADLAYEQKYIQHSALKVLPSLMGHFAMLGLFEEDFQAIDGLFSELLAS